jgi:hypothetical protein
MKHSPFWESSSRSIGQELLRLLRNTKVHYCVHKSLPAAPVLSQINPVHTLTLFQIDFNIILASTPMSTKSSSPFSFPD